MGRGHKSNPLHWSTASFLVQLSVITLNALQLLANTSGDRLTAMNHTYTLWDKKTMTLWYYQRIVPSLANKSNHTYKWDSKWNYDHGNPIQTNTLDASQFLQQFSQWPYNLWITQLRMRKSDCYSKARLLSKFLKKKLTERASERVSIYLLVRNMWISIYTPLSIKLWFFQSLLLEISRQ